MSFVTRDVALRAVCGLRQTLERLERRNGALGDPARRAASSILLNIEEGNQRRGGDRLGRLLYGLVKPQSKASSRLSRASTDVADDSST